MNNKETKSVKKPSSFYKVQMPLWNAVVLHIILGIGVLGAVLPFYHLVMTSFKTYVESITVPIRWVPESFSLEAYKTVFNRIPLAAMLKNSVITTIIIAVCQIIFSAMAGFVLAIMDYPKKGLILMVCLAILMVPGQIYIIPQFLLIQRMGLVNTLTAIVLPNAVSALGIFLFRQAFMGIPRSLYEAAVLDGYNPFLIFWKIMLPLVRPTIASFGVLAALYSWNSLFWPLVVNSKETKQTLAVGLATLLGDGVIEIPVIMAGAVVALLPMIILFLLFNKQLLENNSYMGDK